jgi:Flp pilus assembly protein TadD
VERIDLAELSRDVLDHAGFFAAANGGVLDDPKVAVFVDDGRQYLRAAPPAAYDLVTLEPPPMSHAGVASLYSRELYTLARSRLREGGFLTQWLPVEQLQGPETLSVVRAFVDVFPAAVLLSGEGRDLILMGTTGPSAALDVAALARRLGERPRVAEDLARVDLGRLSEIVGTFAAGAETLRRATAGVSPITDDAPSMEYSVMSKLSSVRVPAELFDVGGVASFCPGCGSGVEDLADLPAYLDVLGRLYASSAFLCYRSFAPAPVAVDVPAALEGDDQGARARAILGSAYLQRMVGIDPHGLPSPLKPARLAALTTFVDQHPDSAVAALRLGLAHLADGRVPEAEALLGRALGRAPAVPAARFGHARALARLRRLDEGIASFRTGLDLAPRDAPARAGLLDALTLAGRRDELAAEATRLLGIDPESGAAHRVLCVLDVQRDAVASARDHCQRALDGGATVDPRLLEALSLGP